MTEESDKGSGSQNSEKADVEQTDIPGEPQPDRLDLPPLKFDDTSDHDFYERPIAESSNDVIAPISPIPINEVDEIELPGSGNADSSTASIDTELETEFLDIGIPTVLATSSQGPKPLDESDAIVRWLRHGDELEEEQQNQSALPSGTEMQLLAPAYKRLLARIFDLTWILLLLQVSLAAFLYLVNSPAFYLVSQSLPVQLGLAIVLLLPALILEAAILSDFGNTPGKSLFGLRIKREGQDKIKFRQYFGRGCLLWIKGLACGIPILSILTLLWQYFRLSKHKITGYDKTMSMQVIAVKTTLARKFFLLLSVLLLIGLVGYLMPIKNIPPTASGAWGTLQGTIYNLIGDTGIDLSSMNPLTKGKSE